MDFFPRFENFFANFECTKRGVCIRVFGISTPGQSDGGRNVAIFPVIPCMDGNLDGECRVPCLRQG